MRKEFGLTNEEKELLLEVLFQQNYASEILAVELSDIESGLKKTNISQYK
ncbi:TPA: antirepressor AbbA, partial [Bacillus cytotoxicus]|nr:antirepressor AbbA [Bacillus cytotoxicus]